jgi:hypothetical protein
MIASLFSKSRPFNYIFVLVVLVMSYLLYVFHLATHDDLLVQLGKSGINFVLLLLGLFVIDFITKRNNLSKDSSYDFLLYLCFLLLFPTLYSNINIVISGFFILLALRRLISLHSLVTPKEKIFDASLWIFAASIFHFWAILFIVLVFVSIIFHVASDYKNWILPFIAFFAVGTLFLLASLLLNEEWIAQVLQKVQVDFNFYYFTSKAQNIALSVYATISVLFVGSMMVTLSKRSLVLHASYKKVIVAFFAGIAVFCFSPNKSNDLMIFTVLPFVILGTSYLEYLKDKLWKEIITICVFFVSFLLFIFQL